MKKPTFEEFIRMIYGLSMDEYWSLNEFQRKAIDIDYHDRYGRRK